ncbi:hypothetical protein IWZ03DRAFT_357679 [Phyllosticta citriasiana]|uniref:Uncharacterized protein n=2 Tax=Phyllosticta citriasiana TaxID=595635 RepID=A0ABR1KY04_9PEZI
MHIHTVFPAIAVNQIRLRFTLDQYLSDLVDSPIYFHSFPLFRSRLQVFEHAYNFYRSLDKSSPHHRLLHNALKLLVLVHVGDVTELDPSAHYDPSFFRFMGDGIASDSGASGATTPCFIRSQLGAAVPALASALLSRTLTQLHETSLGQRHDSFPAVIATIAIVLMARESVQYHAARLAYHARLDECFAADTVADMEATIVLSDGPNTCSGSQQSTRQPTYGPEVPPSMAAAAAASSSEHSFNDPKPDPIDRLLAFYRACYGRAHAAHLPSVATHGQRASSSTARQTSGQPAAAAAAADQPPPMFPDAPNQHFINALRQTLTGDETARYVRERVGIGVNYDVVDGDERNDWSCSDGNGGGMVAFFDRLLARLFVGGGVE